MGNRMPPTPTPDMATMTADAPGPRFDGRDIEAVLIDAGGVLVEPNWETVASVLNNYALNVDPADVEAANPHLMRELDDVELIRSSTDVMRRERWLARLLRHAGRT